MRRAIPTRPPGSPEVVVVGGANVDLVSRPVNTYQPATSNPGTTTLSAGGVARNVAEVLGRLGVRTSLLTAVGADAFADVALAATRDAGVDTSRIVQRADVATGVYNAILDHHGELVGAVSAMSAVDDLSPGMLEPHREHVASARWIIADGNLSAGALEWAMDVACDAGASIALDPVSVAKAQHLLPLLGRGRIALVTPNLREFHVLCDEAGDDEASLTRGCAALHGNDVDVVWVRLGSRGSLVSTRHEDIRLPPPTHRDVRDVTGAGDAMLAAYVWASLRGHDPVIAARYGAAAAGRTVSVPTTTDPDLDAAALEAAYRSIEGT